jgi:hypothetical protein
MWIESYPVRRDFLRFASFFENSAGGLAAVSFDGSFRLSKNPLAS